MLFNTINWQSTIQSYRQHIIHQFSTKLIIIIIERLEQIQYREQKKYCSGRLYKVNINKQVVVDCEIVWCLTIVQKSSLIVPPSRIALYYYY